MRLTLLTLAGLLFTGCCYGQAPAANLEGTILDQATGRPIPYAWVRLKNQQSEYFADELGHFVIDATGQLQPDTLIANGVGYLPAKQVFAPNASAKKADISLQRVVIPTAEMPLLISKVKFITLGSRRKVPGEGMIQAMPGAQFACLLKNETGRTLEKIRAASFFIAENGQPQTKFRVRVYAVDKASGGPGKDLLVDNVIVSAPQGGAWFTIDLTLYNIPAPQEGFFVAMEWLRPSNFSASTFVDGNSGSYGQIMRPTFEFKESRTWNYTMGKGWSLITAANAQGLRYNAMIKAEVDMIK